MKRFLKAGVALAALVAGLAASAPTVDAFPSWSFTPGSPGAGPLTPGGVLNPATGAPTPGGPQGPPVLMLTAASLGLPPGGNIEDFSYGDDGLLAAGAGAGPLVLEFSVTNAAVGGPWLPAGAPNVLTQGVAGEGAAGADIFVQGAAAVPPPFGALGCGLGGNAQLYDADGINAVGPLPPGLGGMVDPPPPPAGAPWDDLDAYEALGAGAVDYQTFLAPGFLTGPDGRPDAAIFFTVDPATAGGMGVSPADVLVTDRSSPTGWSIYAPAAALGLVAGDNVDALLVGDSASIGPGAGGTPPPGRTYGPHPTDFIAYSLAPGSPSLAPASPLPPVCAPGAKFPGDVWGVTPFIGGGAPFAIYSAEGLGICSPRAPGCPAVGDNLDAMDIGWAADGDADNAPDPLEGPCGAGVGPPDTDGDGLSDSIEMTLSTSPAGICMGSPLPGAFDTDLDGMPDSWEIAHWSPTCGNTNPSAPDAGADGDGDGVPNITEMFQGTSPCNVDTDGDGFQDLVATAHPNGPGNTNLLVDNCPNVANALQLNADGNFIDQSPPKAFDDYTWPNSDAMGDACDVDDDNDGLLDTTETGPPCSGSSTGSTNPLVRDTDGDLVLDYAECLIAGRDPLTIEAQPTIAQCGGAGDLDTDGVQDFREFCYYNMAAGTGNTDFDTCQGRHEIASINQDIKVDSLDLSQVAQTFMTGGYAVPAMNHVVNFDVTKDQKINSLDLSFVAQNFATGGCP